MTKSKNPQIPTQTKFLLHNPRLENFLQSAISYLSITLIFVVLASSASFFYPMVFVKTVIFYALIEIILALFLVLVLLNKKYWPRFIYSDKTGWGKFNWLLILPTIHVATTILSTLFSANPYNSFFGSINWSNGLLTLLHFWGLFIVLVSLFREKPFWLWFLRLTALTGPFLSLMAMYQKFMENEAGMGTFGNPNQLSGYLLFTIFISAILAIGSQGKTEKILWAGVGALGAFTIFSTTIIRGSQLGLVMGISAMLVFYLLAYPKKIVRRVTAGIILTTLVVGLIFSIQFVSSGKIYKSIERADTVATRITNWKMGIQGFSEKPVFGYGLENYHMVLEKYFLPIYYKQQSTEYGFSLPHNKFVEVAVFSGALGLLSYLSLWVGVFWLLYRRFLHTRDFSILALVGMWVSYLVHLFFLFDNIVSFFLLFSLLAFTHFVLQDSPEKNEDAPIQIKPSFAYVFIAIIIFTALSAIYQFAIQPAQADKLAIKAIREFREKKYDASLATLEKMEKLEVFYVEQKALFELSREIEDDLILETKFSDTQKNYLEKITEKNRASIERDPTRLYYHLNASRLEFIAGRFDASHYEKSQALLQGLLDTGSRRMEVPMYMAENFQAMGQNDQAVEFGKKAIAIDPSYGFAHYLFARLYRQMGDNDNAIKEIDAAIKTGYYAPALYYLYADTAVAVGNYDRAIIAFKFLTETAPSDPQNFANLAMAYFEKKDYAKAREVSNKMIMKFPKLKTQVQTFIDKIPN